MSSSPSKFTVGFILAAGGSGSRFGEPKQFKSLKGKPLFTYSLDVILTIPELTEIVVVVPDEFLDKTTSILGDKYDDNKIRVVPGGRRRQDSVLQGLEALSNSVDIVSIHDAARPFLARSMVEETVEKCKEIDGAIVALEARDTIKEVELGRHHILRTLDRSTLWLAQTPQTFHRNKLEAVMQRAQHDEIVGTDEASLMEASGYRIAVVPGSLQNIKITTPEDWALAEKLC